MFGLFGKDRGTAADVLTLESRSSDLEKALAGVKFIPGFVAGFAPRPRCQSAYVA